MTLNQAFKILKKASNPHDAKIVLRHIAGDAKKLTWRESLQVRRASRSLSRNMPVAKIIGKKWFYGMEFATNIYTLDPRPDSETLVEYVLSKYKGQGDINIIDLGTGTGCLLISIVKNLGGAHGVGIDISRRAAAVAKKNVGVHALGDRIKIHQTDFEKTFRDEKYRNKFDVVVSNPPYIPDGDARVNAGARNDPHIALYSGADGLDACRTIASGAKNLLRPGGIIVLEIGAGQAESVKKIFEQSDWKFIESANDLGGIVRLVAFELQDARPI